MDNSKYLIKIESIINNTYESAVELPDTAPVVAMFLKDYRPYNGDKKSEDNRTSQDIITQLEDICQLTTTDVAKVMVFLGYRIKGDEYMDYIWGMTTPGSELLEE